MKGVCVPATVDANDCNGPKGCDEDVLLDGADGGTDAGRDGGHEGGLPTDTNADPVEALEDFCGKDTSFDRNAPWAMPGGCPTGAHRSRFFGPIDAPKITMLDSTPWTALAFVRAPIVAGGPLGPSMQAALTQASDPNDAIAILAQSVLWRRSKELREIDRNDAGVGYAFGLSSDAGPVSLLAGWSVGRAPNVFLTYRADAGLVGCHQAESLDGGAQKGFTFPSAAAPSSRRRSTSMRWR